MRRNFLVFCAAFLLVGLLTCAFNVGSNIGVVPKARAQDDGGPAGQIEGTWVVIRPTVREDG